MLSSLSLPTHIETSLCQPTSRPLLVNSRRDHSLLIYVKTSSCKPTSRPLFSDLRRDRSLPTNVETPSCQPTWRPLFANSRRDLPTTNGVTKSLRSKVIGASIRATLASTPTGSFYRTSPEFCSRISPWLFRSPSKNSSAFCFLTTADKKNTRCTQTHL